MKKINEPGSQIEEVLHSLITRLSITRQSMMIAHNVLNLPDVIFRLRHAYGLKIKMTVQTVFNKYGITVDYGMYSIDDKKTAISVYNKIQKYRIDYGTI